MGSRPIDIIIPVYDAFDDLVLCLESVTRHTGKGYRLIIIDDCSPDSRIAELFERLSRERGRSLILLRNERNLGFVATANRGMALGGGDIVLLNSDTRVTPQWLDNIKRCAASDPRIGTVTPFSNNAEICSFPAFCQDNPVPDDVDGLSRAMERARVPLYPDLPTAVGFCMFIRRRLLDEIGAFDAETFGLGYGEENDFCMRALEAGYRNVLCDDAFVVHLGSRSFKGDKRALAERNMGRLLEKHPDYLDRVRSFITADTLRPIRQMIQTQWMLTTDGHRPGILHILHGRGGGTAKYVDEITHACGPRFRQYSLTLCTDNAWHIKDFNGGPMPLEYTFQPGVAESWSDLLGSVCAWLDIGLCHVHSVIDGGDGLIQALQRLSLPYGLSIHDLYLACPNVHLLNVAGDYCGTPVESTLCQACLDSFGQFVGLDITAWRRRHRLFIESARFVLAPSRWARDTLQQYFPGIDISLLPHGYAEYLKEEPRGALFDLPRDGYRHIGVMGAIGPEKGARRLDRLVERTRERGLPLRWIVIGYTDRHNYPYQSQDMVFIVHGRYRPGEIVPLLDHYDVRLVVFPLAGPETYCYTLTEAWLAGRPALVSPIGAVAERVEATGAGWIARDWEQEDGILDQILSLTSPEHEAELVRRSDLARHAVEMDMNTVAGMVASAYASTLSGRRRRNAAALMPASRTYEAACRALAVAPLEAAKASSRRRGIVTPVRRCAERLRDTMPGRLAARTLPLRMRAALRRLLYS